MNNLRENLKKINQTLNKFYKLYDKKENEETREIIINLEQQRSDIYKKLNHINKSSSLKYTDSRNINHPLNKYKSVILKEDEDGFVVDPDNYLLLIEVKLNYLERLYNDMKYDNYSEDISKEIVYLKSLEVAIYNSVKRKKIHDLKKSSYLDDKKNKEKEANEREYIEEQYKELKSGIDDLINEEELSKEDKLNLLKSKYMPKLDRIYERTVKLDGLGDERIKKLIVKTASYSKILNSNYQEKKVYNNRIKNLKVQNSNTQFRLKYLELENGEWIKKVEYYGYNNHNSLNGELYKAVKRFDNEHDTSFTRDYRNRYIGSIDAERKKKEARKKKFVIGLTGVLAAGAIVLGITKSKNKNKLVKTLSRN